MATRIVKAKKVNQRAPARKTGRTSAATKKTCDNRKVAGIGAKAVQARTDKSWAKWLTVLDKAGGKKMDHASLARYVHEQYGIPGWWAQMVTVGYEQARGLREKHQKPEGYEISRSKTINVGVSALFAAWQDKRRRERWLPKTPLTIRRATRNKSLRIAWIDGKTSVDANFYAKGTSKSQITVQHRKLNTAKEAARMKSFWKDRLEGLKLLLEA
jgi:hypothetical protein